MTKPPWLTKTAIVVHSSGVAFQPVQLKSNGKLLAIDSLSNLYAVEECQPANPDSFLLGREFINHDGSVVWVERTDRGLRINGCERVRIPDEVDIACDRLAEVFNGSIVSDVPKQFQIQEVDDDDTDW